MQGKSMDKKSFLFYLSYETQFNMLSDESAGKLIKAVLAHANGEDVPPIEDPVTAMAFSFICAQMERDNEAYDRRCESNRINGMKGGRPRKQPEPEKPSDPPAADQKPFNIKTEPARVEYWPPPIEVTPEGAERWNEFWKLYPKKVAENKARNAFYTINPDEELFGKMMSALKIQVQSEQWKKDGRRFVPNPETWLNGKRWEDKIDEVKVETAPKHDPWDNPFKDEV